MPFCPKCRGEFQDWVKICPDCKLELVEKLPSLPESVNDKLSNENLVTIARFSHPEEAYLASAKLESEGIWSFLADEHTVTADWLVSYAIGGVRLQVKESDAADARRILSLSKTDVELAAGTGRKCPKCGSTDIKYERFSQSLVFISWLAIGFPLPFFKRKWKCNSCGYQWQSPS